MGVGREHGADVRSERTARGRVREFLTWVGRETGREVVFATPESAAEADRAVLSGSVAGLRPAQALSAVLPTTNLESIERDGQIVVSMAR